MSQRPGILICSGSHAQHLIQGGTPCVAAPIERTGVRRSARDAGGDDCSGSFRFDFDAQIQGGPLPSSWGRPARAA